jgi:hypothetical protein
MPALPPGEEGWFGHLLDVALYIVAALAVCALVFMAGRALYRHRQAIARLIGKLLGRIAAFLSRTGQNQAEPDLGFVDEETDVSVWQPLPQQRKRAWLGRLFGPSAEKWDDMADNRERVRYLYREWLHRLARDGYSSPPHLTPEEIRQQAVSRLSSTVQSGQNGRLTKHTAGANASTADADLVRLYYKARYDSSDITDAELSTVARERGKPRNG